MRLTLRTLVSCATSPSVTRRGLPRPPPGFRPACPHPPWWARALSAAPPKTTLSCTGWKGLSHHIFFPRLHLGNSVLSKKQEVHRVNRESYPRRRRVILKLPTTVRGLGLLPIWVLLLGPGLRQNFSLAQFAAIKAHHLPPEAMGQMRKKLKLSPEKGVGQSRVSTSFRNQITSPKRGNLTFAGLWCIKQKYWQWSRTTDKRT